MSRTQEGCVHEASFRCQEQKLKSNEVKPGELMELEGPGVDLRHSWIQENICHSLMRSRKLRTGWEGTGTPEAQTTT